jgi:hypothetical protein
VVVSFIGGEIKSGNAINGYVEYRVNSNGRLVNQFLYFTK